MTSSPAASRNVSQLFDLSERTALITGATGHLGRSMADALAEAGARVVVASRQIQTAKTVAEQLSGPRAGDHLATQMDQLDESSIQAGFRDAVRQAGAIDILVNNGHSPLGSDWSTVTGAEFQQQLANVTGYFLLSRLLRDHAVEHGMPASIILLGSMYGVVGSYPDAYEGVCAASPAAYHALKGGVVQLTRHLAVYWARDAVRVNCLSPGPFPSHAAPEELVRRLKSKSPMERMGRPEELKGAIVFLASDASSYMTGQNLIIDGGWTAW
ncbi:MAG: SDR family oxidoreductase [Planctomycetaceae bacterium]|nr:SDR family oxidoreductase [Planctomycetaceae bacterium]